MNGERALLAAQGYIELQMFEDALKELDNLPPPEREGEAAQHMRLFILMRERHWNDALVICERLRDEQPNNTTGFIHAAFCLHEMGRTSEARQLLLSGPRELLEEPTYHYNMGCYAAVLGDLEEARQHLDDSFKMDKKFRTIAKLDPDLHAVKDFL